MSDLPNTVITLGGPSVQGASPALLAELLDTLEDELRRVGLPTAKFLRPGAHPDFVREVFDRNGLIAPDEAVAWFGWHDGPTRVADGNQPLPKFEVWSLEEAEERRHSPGAQPIGTGPDEWDAAWFQFMGPSAELALNCANRSDQPPLVRALSHTREMGTQPEQVQQQSRLFPFARRWPGR